ncbi:hypothetical protein TNCV_2542251 [Trichonephila clavipes]|nr:hypothetical protein TNCV_2542251 [Trichonephila clavipes]
MTTELHPATTKERAESSLVARASDSRPEGCRLIHECRGLENISLRSNFIPKLWKWRSVVSPSVVKIYRPFGEFRRASSYCHLYGAQNQGQRQA